MGPQCLICDETLCLVFDILLLRAYISNKKIPLVFGVFFVFG